MDVSTQNSSSYAVVHVWKVAENAANIYNSPVSKRIVNKPCSHTTTSCFTQSHTQPISIYKGIRINKRGIKFSSEKVKASWIYVILISTHIRDQAERE